MLQSRVLAAVPRVYCCAFFVFFLFHDLPVYCCFRRAALRGDFSFMTSLRRYLDADPLARGADGLGLNDLLMLGAKHNPQYLVRMLPPPCYRRLRPLTAFDELCRAPVLQKCQFFHIPDVFSCDVVLSPSLLA